MKMKELFNRLLAATVALVASWSALADDGSAYVTGAECEVSNEWLFVKSGIGTITNQFKVAGKSATHLQIEEGATLKLGIDVPFNPSALIHLFGTLDLNGHDLSALRMDNSIPFVKADGSDQPTLIDTNSLRRVPGRIINTSVTGVRLNLSSAGETVFYGSIEECPGKISFETANAPFQYYSAVAEIPPSSVTVKGTSTLRYETAPYRFKFVFQPPSDPTKPIRLGEIELTYRGKTVPLGTAVYATSSDSSAGSRFLNIKDCTAIMEWVASEPGVQTVSVTLSKPSQVDGYRITPGNGTDGRPTGWDVYAYRDSFGSVLVDSRRDVQWYSRRERHTMTNFTFNAYAKLGPAFGTNTAVALTSTASPAFRISSIEPLPVGTLTGAGNIQLEQGSALEPGDISGYTGAFAATGDAWWKIGRVCLSALRGGTEQPVSVTSAQNLAVENGGAEPVSVLLDDSRADEHLFGKLADGENGALGLVKRGSGERVIETEDAAYTGPTAIHGGTLTVAKRRSAPYSARYIKITPTATYGTYDSSSTWGMNEFVLLDANGNRVSWPSGTSADKLGGGGNVSGATAPGKLIDGDTTTRMLVKASTDIVYTYPPVVIDTSNGVTFVSYEWWSPHGNSADKNRTPIQWTVEISDDKEHWVVCDCGESSWTSADDAAATAGWTGANSVMRGPFTASGHAKSTGTKLYTLEAESFGAGSPVAARDTHRKLKSRYFMFQVKETANPERDANSYGWEAAEISLYKDGERVDWPAAVKINLYGANLNNNNNSKLTNLVNNVIWEPTGGVTGEGSTAERAFVMEVPSYVVIDAGEEIEFDAYAFYSTNPGGTFTARIPKAWNFGITTKSTLSEADPFADFSAIDWMGNYTPGTDYVITQAYQRIGPFDVASKFPILDTDAANSIGDRSPVAIDEGATLKIDADYEQFGPLSGAGSLDLVLNAVGEINACAPATFSGSVTGEGTLAVCGTDVQTFDGASLSGVKTLELNGGAIAGTASFGDNDVTVAFNGGATGAALSGIGTLTVTGEVKYALPDLAGQSVYSATLFTATNIPAASQELLGTGVVDAPHGWLCNVTVTATSVTLEARKRGLLLLIK